MLNQFRACFLFFVCGLLPITLSAQIVECSSIEELLYIADPALSELIILDIDNTLYHPKQMVGSDEWFEYYLKQQQEKYGKSHEALETCINTWQAIQAITKVVPIETKTQDIILRLQKKHSCVMAMTTRSQTMAVTTFHQFLSLDIDLSESAPTNVRFQLTKYPFVLFEKGVLFTNGYPKGEVLKEFLAQLQWMPDHIIYINDKKDPLEEVEASLPKQVRFLGLRYSGADHYIEEFVPDIAEAQLHALENIPSNDDAHLMSLKQEIAAL